jgi:hypothetical protein
MDRLLNHPNLLFPSTDKGLGPCAVKYDQYVRDALVHLTNETVYERMTEENALQAVSDLQSSITNWIETHQDVVPAMAQRFIKKHMSEAISSPFGQFYILYKIHKGKKNCK